MRRVKERGYHEEGSLVPKRLRDKRRVRTDSARMRAQQTLYNRLYIIFNYVAPGRLIAKISSPPSQEK